MTVADTSGLELRSLNNHGLVGVLSVFVLFGGLIWWTAVTDVSGAVVAHGAVVVESYPKQVQHREGGTVAEILVHNEDKVVEGQVLVKLDTTTIGAGLAVATAQLNEGLAREARLVAEVSNTEIVVPDALANQMTNSDVSASVATQRQIKATREAARDGRVAQLNEQVVQLEKQVEGLQVQATTNAKQLDIVTKETAGLASLVANQLVLNSRMTDLGKQQASFEGEGGRLVQAIAQTRAAIAEKRIQITQVADDFLNDSLDQLQQTRQVVAEARQQVLAAQDRLAHTDILAPQSGIVHESVVHTVGGVISPGEVLMQIVPQDDLLLVNIRIEPLDIDKLALGQDVMMRLSNFSQRTTPEVPGAIVAISPDLTEDPVTRRSYYGARVKIDAASLAKLPPAVKLIPGMPVETFIKTADRTVLDYLIHPIVQEMSLAFREE